MFHHFLTPFAPGNQENVSGQQSKLSIFRDLEVGREAKNGRKGLVNACAMAFQMFYERGLSLPPLFELVPAGIDELWTYVVRRLCSSVRCLVVIAAQHIHQPCFQANAPQQFFEHMSVLINVFGFAAIYIGF